MHRKRTRRALLQRVEAYLELLQRMRHQHDEETIHDFRVASRNLLALYPLFPNQRAAKQWRKPVRRRLRRLNRLRDLQVMRGRLGDAQNEHLGREISEEHQRLDVVGGKRPRHRLERRLRHSARKLVRYIDRHPRGFEARVREEWFRIHRQLNRRLLAADASQPDTLHKLRVAYKAFRYMAEFLSDAGALSGLKMTELKYWQDLLGDIQDYRVAGAWLQHHPEGLTPEEEGMLAEGLRLRRGFIRRRRRFRAFINGVVW